MVGGPRGARSSRIPESTDPATRQSTPQGHFGLWRHAPSDPAWSRNRWDRGHGRERGNRGHGRRPHGRLHLRNMRRVSEGRVLAGICGGLSDCTGIDVTIVRIGFVLIGLASGFPVLVYALAWLIVPMDTESSTIFSRAVNDRRGIRLLISVIPVVVVTQIVVSLLHLGFIGIISWPVFLAAGLSILIWRNASEPERAWMNNDLVPMLSLGNEGHGRGKLILRVAAGAILAVGGIGVLVFGHTTRAALRPLGGALLVIAAIVIVFGPWWLSLVRDLMAERQARALAEERGEMAAHVHDSVLQTLALIQRAADDPQHVVRLARAQERELRAWLFEGRAPGTFEATLLSEGVGLLQRQVEADHGITVQVVVVGECPLTDGVRALLDAAREATVNAAKWSGAPQVSVYAEVEPGTGTVMLFVRDRGRGFDPDQVPDDRQGIARSIRARVSRYGGTAAIRSSSGEGTEVALTMPRTTAPTLK